MKKLIITLIAFSIAVCSVILFNVDAYAANPADFNPGRIIDDEVFYNKDTMSVGDIQAFLNAHTPPCDTWGTQPSGYRGLTNAQYAQQVMGWPGPPYVCLNNYHENPSTGQTSFEMGGGAFAGGISAAQIIYNASQQYRINPQVLLVTLRKESLNLYSDSWPMKSQYKYAMGYACPDSGPNNSANCNANYAGFYNQIVKSAWQLRYYYDHMGSYNYAPGRWNTIQYSPDPNCGTKNVFIDNYATASLYIYTPYTPNQAALNAYPGTAPCGAYGNRNFWFMWQEWFGSTYAGVHITSPLRVTSQFNNSVFTGIPTTVSFDITNDSSSPVNVGGMAVTVRDSSGINYDYPLVNMVIPARSTVTYKQTQTFTKEDVYTFSLANYSNGAWRDNYPGMLNVVEPRAQARAMWTAPSLTQGVAVQGGQLHVNKTSTITYTVKNNSASTRSIGSFALYIRGPNGQNLDPAAPQSITLAAGQSQTLSFQFKPPVEGRYVIGQAALLANWTPDYPIPLGQVVNNITAAALPQVTLESSVSSLSTDFYTGKNTPLQFTVKNHGDTSIDVGKLGLWGRDSQGRNVDPGVVPTVLNAGETRAMSFGFKPQVGGSYTFGILGLQNGVWNEGPDSPSGYSKKLSVTVKPGVTVSSSLKLQDGSLGYVGELNAIQFTIKNYGDDAVNLGKLGLWGRDPQGRNVDPGVVPTVLNAGETRVMSLPMRFTVLGTYKFGILQTTNNGVSWSEGPALESNVKNDLTVKVTNGAYIGIGLQSSVDVQQLHATQVTNLTFSVTNQTDRTLDLGKLGLWGRDSQGRNVDPGVVPTVLNAGETRVMSFPMRFTSGSGTYSFGILGTLDNGASWNSGPDIIAGQSANLQTAVKPSVTITGSVISTPTNVSTGQCVNISFTVVNHDAVKAADLGKLGLWGRDPQGRNVDPGVVPTVLNAGETKVVTLNPCLKSAGTYSFGLLQTKDNGASWSDGPVRENGTITTQVQVKAT